MRAIQLATVLPGARGFDEDNVNDTYRGQVLLADGAIEGAVLKDLAAKQLANEVLASVLARAAGLPTPDAYLAVVRGADLTVKHAPMLQDGNRLVFASVDVRVPNVTFLARQGGLVERVQLLRDIVEWTHLGSLYAFDTWIANVDRHPGNLLFGGKNQMWLIDHGHSFSGPDWNPDELDPSAEYRNRLAEWLTGYLTDDQRRKRSGEIAQFAEAVAAIDVSDTAQDSRVAAILPHTLVDAVEAFLTERTKSIPLQACRALGVLL